MKGKLCNSQSEIMILSKHAAILTFHVSFQHRTSKVNSTLNEVSRRNYAYGN